MKKHRPPKEERHPYELLQSITTIKLEHPHDKTRGVVTTVRVWRDQKKLQASYHIDDQDLRDALARIDPYYRKEIVEAIVDLPGVRRIMVTDAEGDGFVVEN